MPTSSPKNRSNLRDDYRRVLRLHADSPDGATEGILLAHGFKLGLLVELIGSGLATAKVAAQLGRHRNGPRGDRPR